jgi:hypothetical protein
MTASYPAAIGDRECTKKNDAVTSAVLGAPNA